MKNHALLFVLLLSCLSCQSKFQADQLHGAWRVDEWKIESTGNIVSNTMDMAYQSDGTYVVDYGSKKEAGKYWIANDFLHTIEEGQAEKKVKIVHLTADTLIIQMNRSGQLELVRLLRK